MSQKISKQQTEDKNQTSDDKGNAYVDEISMDEIKRMGNTIRVTDEDETCNLKSYCYTNAHNKDDSDDNVKKYRGVVFDDDEVVMRAFPYTTDYEETDVDNITRDMGECLDKYSFYDSYEGVLIRVFCYKDKWFTTTHRKLNAFRSKWASRESFGTAFKKALEFAITHTDFGGKVPTGEEPLLTRFQTVLDKKHQYMFLVLNSDSNRIVCRAPDNPTVLHVGTFIDGKLSLDNDIGLPRPKKLTFKNVAELVEYVHSVDMTRVQGVICFAPDNRQYKIVNKYYKQLFLARGNEPSIKFRYLQVRMNRQTSEMLYYLYPSMESMFDDIENKLYDIARNIYVAYVQRFIKKRFVTVPNEDFLIIKECHKWHEQDRKHNRISLEKVIDVMNAQSPTCLNRMIRRVKNEAKNSSKLEIKTRLRSNTNHDFTTPVAKPLAEPAGTTVQAISI